MNALDRRRERARLAQRKSRARRQEDAKTMEMRADELFKALEKMTEAALIFSGDVLSNARSEQNGNSLMQSLKPFLMTSLASAQLVERVSMEDSLKLSIDRGNFDNNADNGKDSNSVHDLSMRPTQQEVESFSIIREPQQSTISGKGHDKHGMAFELWPMIPVILQVPFDIRAYIPADSNGPFSFAMLLYWTTLHYVYQAALQSTMTTFKRIFQYALYVETFSVLKSRIEDRVSFTPAAISSLLPTHQLLTDTSQTGLRDTRMDFSLIDRHKEAQTMDNTHEKIQQAMRIANEEPDMFLDAYGVEQRLYSKWNIKFGLSKSGSGESSFLQSSQSSPRVDLDGIIVRLAQNSRCLGNGIGFPIAIVDNAIAQH